MNACCNNSFAAKGTRVSPSPVQSTCTSHAHSAIPSPRECTNHPPRECARNPPRAGAHHLYRVRARYLPRAPAHHLHHAAPQYVSALCLPPVPESWMCTHPWRMCPLHAAPSDPSCTAIATPDSNVKNHRLDGFSPVVHDAQCTRTSPAPSASPIACSTEDAMLTRSS